MKNKNLQIFPASYYECTEELWIITCYFNSSNYATKLVNYEKFKQKIVESGLNLLTVECVFGDSDFKLYPSKYTIQVRAKHVMWQKERLLNIAIQSLPKKVEKIVWLDCDILFSNPLWAVETAKLLDYYPIVQPFRRMFRLPINQNFYNGEAESFRSYGYVLEMNPTLFLKGNFKQHGHTGLAWAGRRDLLEKYGLYDALISGSADHMMAHAMCGDFNSSCVKRIMGANEKLLSHFCKWGKSVHQIVRGEIGYTRGSVFHLWHGETANRQYVKRHDELMKCDFDPEQDIHISESGAWEWTTYKPELHEWAINYFHQRKEDGEFINIPLSVSEIS